MLDWRRTAHAAASKGELPALMPKNISRRFQVLKQINCPEIVKNGKKETTITGVKDKTDKKTVRFFLS
jgi:hypothetical protein